MTPAEALPRMRALLGAGRYAEAEALGQEMLAASGDAQWRYLLGVAQHLAGRHAEAAATLEAAAAASPGDRDVHNTLGAVHLALGDIERAHDALTTALRIDAGHAEARFNLALLLQRQGRLDEALAHLETLLRARPDHGPARLEAALVLLRTGRAAEAWNALAPLAAAGVRDARVQLAIGSVRAALGDAEGAARHAGHAVTIAPGHPDVHLHAGDLLTQAGRGGEAREHYAFVVAQRPRDAAALEKLAAATYLAGDRAGAIELLREHLKRVPGARLTAQNLAVALQESGEPLEAIRVLGHAVANGHDDARMLDLLATAKAMVCQWDGLDEVVERLRGAVREARGPAAHPQSLVFHAAFGPEDIRTAAERWAREHWPHPAPRPALRARTGRLRVGFLSGDFHEHAVSWLMAALPEAHDRERFEFVAYSHGPHDGSALRARLERGFDRFADIAALDDRAAAHAIRADAVDVLLDLGGYTARSRLGILAHRPAPVQAHYLGYPATTGAGFVDYFVGDAETIPPALERGFSESVVPLARCFLPTDPARAIEASPGRAHWGLPAQGFVFGSFNQPVKITERTFARWCRLLEAVPGSVVWLTAFDPHSQQRLRAEARARGIDPARVVFAERIASHAQHLGRLAHIDLGIDTFPYGSHTTAVDLLWAGVPLVTRRGETFASRVAASALATAGCRGTTFDDDARELEAILHLARTPAALDAARAEARAAARSPLFDAAAHARAFESAIMAIEADARRRFAAGAPPGVQ